MPQFSVATMLHMAYGNFDHRPTVTNTGGHSFANLTNCDTILAIPNPTIATTLLQGIQQL